MKRLLLVHDNPLFREALALLLEWNMGLDSVQAGSAAEVRRILSGPHGEVGLAVVDIDLPGRDGIELIEELREPWLVSRMENCPPDGGAAGRRLPASYAQALSRPRRRSGQHPARPPPEKTSRREQAAATACPP